MRLRYFFPFTLTLLLFADLLSASPSVDETPDITGGVIPVITYDPEAATTRGGELNSGGRLSQRGDVRFIVRVKNQTGDPIEADSLIIVIQKLQEMSQLRDVTESGDLFNGKIDFLGADGRTEDGKPYFRVPVGGNAELEPYGESEPIIIEIRNPQLLRLYPPVLRVRGVRRTPSQDFQNALQDSLGREVRPPPETPKALYLLQALLDH